jgi:enoyl-CoA hydratase/carnithine racemase
MVDYGRLMIHDPSFEGKLSDKDKRALDSIKDSLVKIFVNHTILNEADISDYMLKETWFNATDAKDYGFIDEIVATKRTLMIEEGVSVNALYELTNQFLKPKPKTNKMDKITNHFGLSNEATQEDVLSKITTLEAEKTQKEKELSDEIASKNEEIEALKAKIAENHVETAINEGKFKADKKAEEFILVKIYEFLNKLENGN